jgi:VIT1/CCC1 family predicted Fe2+/Mn2+ transporter
MPQKYSHQLITGVSFGLTSAVITSLGVIVGLQSATASKLAVVAGIVVLAIADGLADAAGLHMAEEAETEKGKAKHSSKEVWLITLFTFLSVSGFILTFAVPFLVLPFQTAVSACIAWGTFLLITLNFYLAKLRKVNPIKIICEHLLLAAFVIAVSYWIGGLIAVAFE